MVSPRSDGDALPDLTEVLVLRQLGLATAPAGAAARRAIASGWVASTWRDNHDTRAAVATLARLGETHLEFSLGQFIGLDDEWTGRWGRSQPGLRKAAEQELDRILPRLR